MKRRRRWVYQGNWFQLWSDSKHGWCKWCKHSTITFVMPDHWSYVMLMYHYKRRALPSSCCSWNAFCISDTFWRAWKFACWPNVSMHYFSDVLQFPRMRKCWRLKWDKNGNNWIRVMPRIRHFTLYNASYADILQWTMYICTWSVRHVLVYDCQFYLLCHYALYDTSGQFRGVGRTCRTLLWLCLLHINKLWQILSRFLFPVSCVKLVLSCQSLVYVDDYSRGFTSQWLYSKRLHCV